jgi:hypothetical protein
MEDVYVSLESNIKGLSIKKLFISEAFSIPASSCQQAFV